MQGAEAITAWDGGSAGDLQAHRHIRVTRGVSASTVAVLAAAAAHVAAGGAVPSPALLTTVLVIAWLPGIALIGVAVRLWRQVTVIAVGEAMLHGVLALQAGSGSSAGVRAAGSPSTAGASGMTGMSGMSTMAEASSAAGSTGTPVGPVTGRALGASTHLVAAAPMAWMWAGHVVAAAVTVLLWRRGEADIARIVAVAARGLARLRRKPATVLPSAAVRALPAVAEHLTSTTELIGTAHPRRGPPLPA